MGAGAGRREEGLRGRRRGGGQRRVRAEVGGLGLGHELVVAGLGGGAREHGEGQGRQQRRWVEGGGRLGAMLRGGELLL